MSKALKTNKTLKMSFIVLMIILLSFVIFGTTSVYATEEYNLWIAGTRVTSDNLSGDGWSYNPETKELQLTNYQWASTAELVKNTRAGIYCEEDLTIIVSGTNSIVEKSDDGYSSVGIYVYKDDPRPVLTIKGDGVLTVSGTQEIYIGDMNCGIFAGELVVSDDFTGTINAYGGNSGFDNAMSSMGIFTKSLIVNNGTINAQGGRVDYYNSITTGIYVADSDIATVHINGGTVNAIAGSADTNEYGNTSSDSYGFRIEYKTDFKVVSGASLTAVGQTGLWSYGLYFDGSGTIKVDAGANLTAYSNNTITGNSMHNSVCCGIRVDSKPITIDGNLLAYSHSTSTRAKDQIRAIWGGSGDYSLYQGKAYTNSEGTEGEVELSNTGRTDSLWEYKRVTSVSKIPVVFKSGKEVIETKGVLSGEKVVAPETDPSRTGYTFTGWYADPEMSTKFNFDSQITSATIVYAGYSKDIWTDNTVDESIAIIKGQIKNVNSDTEVSVFEQQMDVTFSGLYIDVDSNLVIDDSIVDAITNKRNEAKNAVDTYITDNCYINKGFVDSVGYTRVWDNRKYETTDPAYNETHNAIIREHIASGGYGRSTELKSTATVENIFPDVEAEKWYTNGIAYCKQHGIMSGYAEGNFGLNDNIARGQIVLMFYRLAGTSSVEGLANPFTDVPEGKYFTDAVKWAVAKNITTGKTATTFDPYGNVTRQELAVFFARYAKNILNKDITSTYNISNIADYNSLSTWARPQMQYIMEKGIITGDMALGYARILPHNSATRAMAATMFARFCQNIVGM